MSPVLRTVLLGLIAAAPLCAGTRQWAELKVGISARQTLTLLGQPLFQRHGRGFDTWTYDQGAEVLLYGGNAVVGWTAPASANLAVRSCDIWSLQPAGRRHATLYSLLEDPDLLPGKVAAPKALPLPPPPAAASYEDYLRAAKS